MNDISREWKRDGYLVREDRALLDVDMIWCFLRGSYWAPNISRAAVQRSIDRSFPYGLYWASQQIGFGRVVSDLTTFAYLADVFVLDDFRGKGLGRWLIEVILEHPDFTEVRRWCLSTRDAQGLYAKFGFTPIEDPSTFMERKGRIR